MKQALTTGGQLSVWFASSQTAFEKMGVTDIVTDLEKPSLEGMHPEFGPISILFIVPEENKTRMEITVQDKELIANFKKSVVPEYKALVKYLMEEELAEKEAAEPAPAAAAPAVAAEDAGVPDVQIPASQDQPVEAWGYNEEPAPAEAPEEKKDEKAAAPKKKGKTIGIIIAAVLVFAIAAGALIYFFVLKPKSTDTPAQPQQQTDIPAEQPADPQGQPSQDVDPSTLITGAQYNQITEGMSYAEVVQIFNGKEGSEVYRNSFTDENGESYELVMYYWEGQGENGANATISFRGDTVVNTSQSGLQ